MPLESPTWTVIMTDASLSGWLASFWALVIQEGVLAHTSPRGMGHSPGVVVLLLSDPESCSEGAL